MTIHEVLRATRSVVLIASLLLAPSLAAAAADMPGITAEKPLAVALVINDAQAASTDVFAGNDGSAANQPLGSTAAPLAMRSTFPGMSWVVGLAAVAFIGCRRLLPF